MDATFYAGNRATLATQLEPNSLLVMAGFGSMQRDVDEPYAFLQEGNFWYLTGIEDPDWRLIIDVDSGEEWLVGPVLNSYQTNFLGGLSADAASARSGVKQVIDAKQGKALLTKLLASKKQAYTLFAQSKRVFGFQQNAAPGKLLAELRGVKRSDVRLTLAKMRGIKQPAEVEAIQAAVDVTIAGIQEVIKNLHSYKTENQIDAALYYEFRNRGATHGFDPIVTSGAKVCTLHVKASNDPLNGWLLMDVGARVNGYSADISRTLPLGKATEREQQVYVAVQRAHDYFLSLLKPGANVKKVFMEQAYPYIGEEMVKLGLIKKPLLNDKNVFKFMPHAVGHGLGIDVHDPLGRPETFAPGMVLTDEVGIYIPEEGFGVRIENDIIITETGARNMCADLPIELAKLAEMVQ